MMKGYADLPIVRDTFAEASDILGQDMWALARDGPAEALNMTVNTQPVMLVAGVAAYRAWEKLGGARPAILAGHSLGEYSALIAAGAMTFKDTLPLVRHRADAMQQAVPEGMGGIAAILGLDDETVRAVCVEAAQGEALEPANLNAPSQVVIAGHRQAVLRGMELAKAKGAKRAVMLPMSAPSHCSLMRPAAEKLQQRLDSVTIQPPQIPVLHNVDVKQHASPAEIKDALVRQLYNPVRWVEIIQAFARDGVTHVAECGPGKVLAGLNKRIAASQQVLALTDADALKQAVTTLTQ